MTVREARMLTALNKMFTLLGLGEQKTKEDKKHTLLLVEKYEMAGFNVSHVYDAEKSKALLTTKTTINHSKSCGSVSLATSKDTKS